MPSSSRERKLLNDLEDARHDTRIMKQILSTWSTIVVGLSVGVVLGYEFLPSFEDYVWLPIVLLGFALIGSVIGVIAYSINLSDNNLSYPWVALRKADRAYNEYIMDQTP